MRNTPLCTAMHETGHAVAQLAHPPAPWIDSISITGLPDGILGLVDTESMWQPYMAKIRASADVVDAYRGLAWKDAIFYLAGPIAELRWRRRCRAALWFGAHEFAERCFAEDAPEPHTDLGRVRARLVWAYPDDPKEAFVRAWLEAEETVAWHWPAVKAIGRLLHQRGRLSDTELLDAWALSVAAPKFEAIG